MSDPASIILDLAIVHHPVRNRSGELIASQIDEFDVFDACRLALTYGVGTLWLVNPIESQRDKAHRLIRYGADPSRTTEGRPVFDRMRYAPTLEAIAAQLTEEGLTRTFVATSATARSGSISFATLRGRLAAGEACMLLLGKASGLADSVFEAADACLEPIDAATGYNHLSVRSAMAILVDRLLARAEFP